MQSANLTWAEVDHAALTHNLREICRAASVRPSGVIAVVKADAYGHGAPEVARTLSAEGTGAFAVARVEEGIALREAGIREPILVLSGVVPELSRALLAHRLTPVLPDLETALALDSALGKASLGCHLKIDTGMARLGLRWDRAGGAVGVLLRCRRISIEGLCTHFADTDAGDAGEAFTREQLARFRAACDALGPLAVGVARHAANSAASIRGIGTVLEKIRPGKAIYGAYPHDDDRLRVSLRPAMSIAARILTVKQVPAGWTAGYGRTWRAERPSRLATIAFGSADGLPRSLSGRGSFRVRGVPAPIVGRICMDLTTLDVTEVPGVAAGDTAVLVGECVTAHEVAAAAGTIFSDVLTSISRRVPRVHRPPAAAAIRRELHTGT